MRLSRCLLRNGGTGPKFSLLSFLHHLVGSHYLFPPEPFEDVMPKTCGEYSLPRVILKPELSITPQAFKEFLLFINPGDTMRAELGELALFDASRNCVTPMMAEGCIESSSVRKFWASLRETHDVPPLCPGGHKRDPRWSVKEIARSLMAIYDSFSSSSTTWLFNLRKISDTLIRISSQPDGSGRMLSVDEYNAAVADHINKQICEMAGHYNKRRFKRIDQGSSREDLEFFHGFCNSMKLLEEALDQDLIYMTETCLIKKLVIAHTLMRRMNPTLYARHGPSSVMDLMIINYYFRVLMNVSPTRVLRRFPGRKKNFRRFASEVLGTHNPETGKPLPWVQHFEKLVGICISSGDHDKPLSAFKLSRFRMYSQLRNPLGSPKFENRYLFKRTYDLMHGDDDDDNHPSCSCPKKRQTGILACVLAEDEVASSEANKDDIISAALKKERSQHSLYVVREEHKRKAQQHIFDILTQMSVHQSNFVAGDDVLYIANEPGNECAGRALLRLGDDDPYDDYNDQTSADSINALEDYHRLPRLAEELSIPNIVRQQLILINSILEKLLPNIIAEQLLASRTLFIKRQAVDTMMSHIVSDEGLRRILELLGQMGHIKESKRKSRKV